MQTASPQREEKAGIGKPPLPHEHGAWVILYAPLMLGFGVAGGSTPLHWLLLLLAVTAAFFAREAAGLHLRKRGKPGNAFWLGLFTILTLVCGLALMTITQSLHLAYIAGIAGGLFGLHSLLLMQKRRDRSQLGETIGAAALTLTAPAAYAVATGRLDATAWLLWGACILYFGSGIVYVKMLLNAAKKKASWNEQERLLVGRDCLAFHAVVLIGSVALALGYGGLSALAILIAYAPALVRGFLGWKTLTPQLPPLKRIGMAETFRALWFTGWFFAALRFAAV